LSLVYKASYSSKIYIYILNKRLGTKRQRN
jgi:hypothetical protein